MRLRCRVRKTCFKYLEATSFLDLISYTILILVIEHILHAILSFSLGFAYMVAVKLCGREALLHIRSIISVSANVTRGRIVSFSPQWES